MKRGRLTNRELDELGKRLVAAARPGESEIDLLVSNPRLYDGVLAKISELERSDERRATVRWMPVGALAGAVLLVSASLLAYVKMSVFDDEFVRAPKALPYVVNEKPFVADAEIPDPRPVAGEEERPRPFRAAATRTVELPPRKRARKPRAEPVPGPEAAFHPIGLAERAEDAAIDGRVVRVEMPRSTLFALGVDLPLENGMRAVKADLLVGADGLPRGIRLVE